eukprot:TRINITY_DN2189_c1_g2_i2.p1 TRINITY_DN2189_c1_g2~~TRINITY_DN2189_c1_g2_i2.p1  ORF type:complete len:138 (+),score=21.43 TRINITY_DN2189_c1_g2_i2:25-438(+)
MASKEQALKVDDVDDLFSSIVAETSENKVQFQQWKHREQQFQREFQKKNVHISIVIVGCNLCTNAMSIWYWLVLPFECYRFISSVVLSLDKPNERLTILYTGVIDAIDAADIVYIVYTVDAITIIDIINGTIDIFIT